MGKACGCEGRPVGGARLHGIGGRGGGRKSKQWEVPGYLRQRQPQERQRECDLILRIAAPQTQRKENPSREMDSKQRSGLWNVSAQNIATSSVPPTAPNNAAKLRKMPALSSL